MPKLTGFKKVTAFPLNEITVTTNGSIIDTKVSNMYSFNTALVDINIGNLGDQDSTKVKIQESDSPTFASGVTTAKGGEEITVSANTQYTMQVERRKRYLRPVITITSGAGQDPRAVACIGMILWNIPTPFPIL